MSKSILEFVSPAEAYMTEAEWEKISYPKRNQFSREVIYCVFEQMRKMNDFIRTSFNHVWNNRRHRLFMSVKARILLSRGYDLQISPSVIDLCEKIADGEVLSRKARRWASRLRRLDPNLCLLDCNVIIARNGMYDTLESGHSNGHDFRLPRKEHARSHCDSLRVLFNPFHDGKTSKNPDVLRLANSLYKGDRTLIPILGDALEDEGLERLKNHFRGECPHYKGCWALDLLLEKP